MLSPDLSKRKNTLLSLIKQATQDLRHMPPGRLRIRCGARPRYYQVTNEKDRTGRYLRKEDYPLVKNLAQKAYLERIMEAASREIALIDRTEKESETVSVEEVYSRLPVQRKELVKPLVLSDCDFVEQWLNEPYEGKEFLETDPVFLTARNERVRSKSEILIANILTELGIPYRYEAPLVLENGQIIYPDFTILNVRTRKVCFLEHCGRMDDPSYLHRFLHRNDLYIRNGYIPGRDVFMTFESNSDPLNINSVRNMLRALFLDE